MTTSYSTKFGFFQENLDKKMQELFHVIKTADESTARQAYDELLSGLEKLRASNASSYILKKYVGRIRQEVWPKTENRPSVEESPIYPETMSSLSSNEVFQKLRGSTGQTVWPNLD